MILIIAEKPSLARNIVAGIGEMKKNNGYYINDHYIVTWAFGHLFTLCDIEDYDGFSGDKKWSLDNIPCFPEKFEFKLKPGKDKNPDSGILKQFETIKYLCNRDDVTEIVNAGDADREGEIIVRTVISKALENEKALKRLWLPDQTPKTVANALKQLKSEEEYSLLANEGYSRTYIDWLYGVNLTRFATLKTGTLLRVGRVIVPVVKAVYDRDMAIKNFVPEHYYALVSKEKTNGEVVELQSKYRFSEDKKNTAERACKKLNSQVASVTDKKTKKESLKPGKLFSLTKLQNFVGKKYKIKMEDSLKAAQDLYERGFLSYPRTNSEYLAVAEKDKIKELLSVISGLGYPVKFKENKSIFDDSKIESHSALTPTYKIPKPDSLNELEKIVYSTVLRRFVAVFCSEECIAEKSEITIDVGTCEQFRLKGTVIIEKGWMKFDDSSVSNKLLPNLSVGDIVNVDFKPLLKETSAPKHYTIETLNNYLKNPFREDKAAAESNEDDSEDYKAVFEGLELGTEATRTGIIGNAISSKYIELKKDTYRLLPGGAYLIEQLSDMGIIMDKYKTSELGQALKKVYHGLITVEDAVNMARVKIAEVFSASCNNKDDVGYTGFFNDYIGNCPLCGGTVKKSRFGFSCSGYKEGCRFIIWNKYSGRNLSVVEVKQLLEQQKTDLLSGFVSKSGKDFSASLKLLDGKIVFDFQS